MLSEKQKNVLDFIEKYFNDKGYSPSYEEIGAALGLSSKSTVFKHIKSLKERGIIDTIPGKKRSIYPFIPVIPSFNKNQIPAPPVSLMKDAKSFNAADIKNAYNNINLDLINNTAHIHLYGYIAAGYPIEAIQIDEFIEVPNNLAGGGSKNIFALKVRGESMIEDMIMDGDIIILKKCREVPNGKIIAAMIDGYEATLKRYYRLKDGRVKLTPSNPDYKPIILDYDKVKIIGELVGLLRKY